MQSVLNWSLMRLHYSLKAATYVGSRQEDNTLQVLEQGSCDFPEALSIWPSFFNICMNALLLDQLFYAISCTPVVSLYANTRSDHAN